MTANPSPESGKMNDAPERADRSRSWWMSPVGLVTLGFLGVAGYFLITEHTAHFFGALPWLLLAACPLMHLFMHHGHHGGHDHSRGRMPARGPEEKP